MHERLLLQEKFYECSLMSVEMILAGLYYLANLRLEGIPCNIRFLIWVGWGLEMTSLVIRVRNGCIHWMWINLTIGKGCVFSATSLSKFYKQEWVTMLGPLMCLPFILLVARCREFIFSQVSDVFFFKYVDLFRWILIGGF